MSTSKDKLARLIELEGYATETALLEACITDSVAPAICMNDGCDYTEELEPDQDRGHCPECKTQTLKSCLILAGVI